MTESSASETSFSVDTNPPWQRLDHRSVYAAAATAIVAVAAPAVPIGIGLAWSGVRWSVLITWLLSGIAAGAVAMGAVTHVRVRTLQFRIGPERIERRRRLGVTRHTSLLRSRVRTVEITANPVQRLLGIADVRLGTGESQGGQFALRSLERRYAERLRIGLLGHPPTNAGGRTGTLARFDPRWARYAPFSAWTPVWGLAIVGILIDVASWFHAVPRLWHGVLRLTAQITAVGTLAVGLGAIIAIGALVSLVHFFEAWWDYRLDREDGGTLRVQRGLLIHRSTTFDDDRLRGLTLVEPLGLRAWSAARLDVIATGMATTTQDDGQRRQSPTLLPSAPREMVATTAEAILGAPLVDDLVPHPDSCRRPRFLRALVGSGACTAVVLMLTTAFSPTSWWLPLTAALIFTPLAIVGALDNARALGHRITSDYVTIRRGALARRTDVLSRRGLLGWNLRQSRRQHRHGLLTVIATSAAGAQAFRCPDIGIGQAAPLLNTAGPVWSAYQTRAHLTSKSPFRSTAFQRSDRRDPQL